MGSGESHFNVLINREGQSHKTVSILFPWCFTSTKTVWLIRDGTESTNHNLFGREGTAEAESSRGPSAYHPNALPLLQSGSHLTGKTAWHLTIYITYSQQADLPLTDRLFAPYWLISLNSLGPCHANARNILTGPICKHALSHCCIPSTCIYIYNYNICHLRL